MRLVAIVPGAVLLALLAGCSAPAESDGADAGSATQIEHAVIAEAAKEDLVALNESWEEALVYCGRSTVDFVVPLEVDCTVTVRRLEFQFPTTATVTGGDAESPVVDIDMGDETPPATDEPFAPIDNARMAALGEDYLRQLNDPVRLECPAGTTPNELGAVLQCSVAGNSARLIEIEIIESNARMFFVEAREV